MGSKTMTLATAQIEHDILSYLLAHPTAKDTLEGIVEWWLLKQEVQRQTETVKEALRELVQKEFVLETREKDGRLHYRLNARKRKEAQRVVAHGPPSDKEAV